MLIILFKFKNSNYNKQHSYLNIAYVCDKIYNKVSSNKVNSDIINNKVVWLIS